MGANDEQIGRLYAILNTYVGMLRGESSGVFYSNYDGDPYDTLPEGNRVAYRLNGFGFRDGPVADWLNAEGYRILVVGDSFTFGEGVRAEDRFTEVLEAELRRSLGREVHVLNADGTGRVRLTKTPLRVIIEQQINGAESRSWNNVAPAWSPDGARILFILDGREVWAISLADGVQTKLLSITADFILVAR